MKKLLIILLLLISTYSFGQAVLSGTRGWDGQYNIRASEFFTRVSNAGYTLTDAQKRWYSDSIFQPLQDSGLIGATRSGDSIQALWGFAKFMGDTTVLKLNLLSDSNTCVSVGTLTWTDSGVVGNGTDSYLNTNFNPTWDSSIATYNSTGLLVYNLKDTTTNNLLGVRESSSGYTEIRISVGNLYYQINTKNEPSHSVTTLTRKVFYANRTTADLQNLYINSVYIETESKASTYKPNSNIIMFARGRGGTTVDTYSTACLSFVAFTSGLSTTKARALSNILNNSLKGRGYNVY